MAAQWVVVGWLLARMFWCCYTAGRSKDEKPPRWFIAAVGLVANASIAVILHQAGAFSAILP